MPIRELPHKALIIFPSLAGWAPWRPEAPKPTSSRFRKSPRGARLVLGDGSGFDITEAGTMEGLAIYRVLNPLEVPDQTCRQP